MAKILVSGILQRETIVCVDSLPLPSNPINDVKQKIHTSVGGDSYNEAIALKWLGDDVKFFSLIGSDENREVINKPGSEILLETDYILPKLSATPAAVIFSDNNRNLQIFEDIKDIRNIEYDSDIFESQLEDAAMLISANANFCKPLVEKAFNAGKTVAVNIRNFKYETEKYNSYFLEKSDIIYLSDDTLEEDPYDFLKKIVARYDPEIIILGQGAKGLIMYNRDNETYVHYNSVKTNEIVNTVGAGNALFSCFLHYYAKSWNPIYSIKNALLFASYKIGFVGTSIGFMTEEQIEQWRELIWK